MLDTISKHLLFGQKAPEWKTQHTASAETFFGAFYRYAPGLSLSDVVYIMDETTIQSGTSQRSASRTRNIIVF